MTASLKLLIKNQQQYYVIKPGQIKMVKNTARKIAARKIAKQYYLKLLGSDGEQDKCSPVKSHSVTVFAP